MTNSVQICKFFTVELNNDMYTWSSVARDCIKIRLVPSFVINFPVESRRYVYEATNMSSVCLTNMLEIY